MKRLLRRIEYLGDSEQECRTYYVDGNAEVEIFKLTNNDSIEYKKVSFGDTNTHDENIIYLELSSFEEGYNRLEEIDGVLYEVMGGKGTKWMLRRKAQLEQNTI